MSAAEAIGVPYLFKLKHTLKVKTLIQQMQRAGAHWIDAGDGWEAIEATLQLSGWSCKRRVILVREAPAIAPIGSNARRRHDHHQPALPGSGQWQSAAAPWSGKIAVLVNSLVTSLDPIAYPTIAMPRLYRERADAEPERSGDSQPQAARRASAARQNVYDELKNQWGWAG